MDPIVQQALEGEYGFRLLRRIGRGGFAEVWEARTAQDVPCALKVSMDPIDSGNPAVRKELENLQLLRKQAGHPHVVSLQDFWVIGGFLVTRWEFAPEGNLDDKLREYQGRGEKGIPPELLLRYMAEAAEGIDFLHSRGIVHRDIKPANLLLFYDRVKVGDLGLAKLVGASTATHSGAGTLGYLPPEAYRMGQEEKGRVSETIDLYALAATYVKLRTGQDPFGRDPMEILERQKQGKPCVDWGTEAERAVVLEALSPRLEERPGDGALNWVKRLTRAVLSGQGGTGGIPGASGGQGEGSRRESSGRKPAVVAEKLAPEILVDPWGGGQVVSLKEAVEQVAPNGVIRLGKGTHHLDEPLEMTKPVRIVGAGKEGTELTCSKPGYVLRFSGTGQFAARGVTFKHVGRTPANVVEIGAGDVILDSCCFSGGYRILRPRKVGAGCPSWAVRRPM